MEFNATFKNILNLLGVNNLVNRQIGKHIETRFFFLMGTDIMDFDTTRCCRLAADWSDEIHLLT